MSLWIDTHAHIYLEEFDEDRSDVLHRAVENDVRKIYLPNIDHTSIDRMLELEDKSNGVCHAMMGLHPCSVSKEFEKELYIVEQWLGKKDFAAIGEIGTDLYWDKTFWEHQKEAFNIQVGWAKKYKLPIVIHCRETLDQNIEMVEHLQDGSLIGVFHCFTGTVEQANRINKLGFYLGIGGVATFKNGGLDKVLPDVGVDSIVLETDSPYLAPVPFRGKRNEPSYIPGIAQRVSDIMQIPVDQIKKQTSLNAQRLFTRHEP